MKLKEDYNNLFNLYEKLCRELRIQLHELLFQEKIITVFPIEDRVKTWESICEKCERNNKKPESVKEITDIAGIRIILLYRRDIQCVCELIEKNFEIVEKEDVSGRLTENQFGYGSIHYIVRPRDEWCAVPTLIPLKGLQAEIQIRTATQHIWAATSHNLQYKKEGDVPGPVKRSINRVAALLETVDLEFDRVLIDRERYIKDGITLEKDDILNTDTLKMLLESIFPLKNKKSDEPYSELLDEIHAIDITKVSKLKEILLDGLDFALSKEKGIVQDKQKILKKTGEVHGTSRERVEMGLFYTHVGLARCVLDHSIVNFRKRSKKVRSKQKK